MIVQVEGGDISWFVVVSATLAHQLADLPLSKIQTTLLNEAEPAAISSTDQVDLYFGLPEMIDAEEEAEVREILRTASEGDQV